MKFAVKPDWLQLHFRHTRLNMITSRTDFTDFWLFLFSFCSTVFLFSSHFINFFKFTVPCGRLSWLLVCFWAHVNIVVSYHKPIRHCSPHVRRVDKVIESLKVGTFLRHSAVLQQLDCLSLSIWVIAGSVNDWLVHGTYSVELISRRWSVQL